MRAHDRAAAAVLLCFLAAGCARIEIYSDPDMKQETGFLFYAPKPYLLVGRADADKPIQVTIKYLPDLTQPFYAKPRPGWIGTSTLSMTFTESGTLSTFSQEVDTKATEMVTAMGGLLTSIATANKTNREEKLSPATPDVEKALSELKQAVTELRAQSGDEAIRRNQVTADEANKLRLYASSVEIAIRSLEKEKPGESTALAVALLKSVADAHRANILPPQSDRDMGRNSMMLTRGRIERALASLTSALPADTYFALYEIRMDKLTKTTTLVPVK